MKSGWKKYLLYASIIIVGGFLLFETVRLKNTGFEGKTLWDWMELLIIPLVLAFGAFYLNRSERNTEREIARDRQQEAVLQAYLDRMAELLLEKKLLTTKDQKVRDVARVRTLTVLRGLDGRRKGLVIKFLYEAKLINKEKPVVVLAEADLATAELSYTNLRDANLRETSLVGANLEKALLVGANLISADLSGANLKGAKLSLRDVGHFIGDDGKVARRDTNILSLSKLTGATMPDGTIHE